MITSLSVYLFMVYGKVIELILFITAMGIIIVGVIGVMGLILFLSESLEDFIEDHPRVFTRLKMIIVTTIICGFISVVVPRQEELFVIYYLPKIVNNERIQKLPEKTLTVIDKYMDSFIQKAQSKLDNSITQKKGIKI